MYFQAFVFLQQSYLIQSQDGVVLLFALNNPVVDKSKDKTTKRQDSFFVLETNAFILVFHEFMKKTLFREKRKCSEY